MDMGRLPANSRPKRLKMRVIMGRLATSPQTARRVAAYGGLAERSNAAVLKTVEVKASRGSNPFLSA